MKEKIKQLIEEYENKIEETVKRIPEMSEPTQQRQLMRISVYNYVIFELKRLLESEDK